MYVGNTIFLYIGQKTFYNLSIPTWSHLQICKTQVEDPNATNCLHLFKSLEDISFLCMCTWIGRQFKIFAVYSPFVKTILATTSCWFTLVLDLIYFFSEAIQQSAQIFSLKEGKVFAQPEAESKVSRRSFTVNVRVKPLIKAELLQEVNLQESGPGIRSVRASFPQWDLRVWQSVLSAHCRGIRCVYEPV